MLDDVGLDKDTFVREAYMQRRLNQVNDGSRSGEEEETESEFQDYQDETDTSPKPVGSTAGQPAEAPAEADPNPIDARPEATSTESHKEPSTDKVDTASPEQLKPLAPALPVDSLKNKLVLKKPLPASYLSNPRLRLEPIDSESKKTRNRKNKAVPR